MMTRTIRLALTLAGGALVATLLVLSAYWIPPTSFHSGHYTVCAIGPRVGNSTVWVPSTIISAPFNGTESGKIIQWSNASGTRVVLTQQTFVTDGNVTAYLVGIENWSVYSQVNETLSGIGTTAPCNSPLTGRPSPTPSLGGGTTYLQIALQRVNDVDLPTTFNGSYLCRTVENYSANCAEGSDFNVSYLAQSGRLSTCGSSSSGELNSVGPRLPVVFPFRWGGVEYNIPTVDPNNALGGTMIWYNYTFPANGGTWLYDSLTDRYPDGAGFSFAFTPCS